MVYEYKCKKCDIVFKMTRPLTEYKKKGVCKCGGEGKRILSTTTFKTCGTGHKLGTIK